MHSFNFDDHSTNTSFASQTNATLTFIEDGVNFTFSVTDTTPALNLGFHRAADDSVFLSNGGGAGFTAIMDVAGGPSADTALGTQFGGTLSLVVSVVGAYNVVFRGNGTGTTTKTAAAPGFGNPITLTAVGQFTQIEFTPANNNFNQIGIQSFSTSLVNCFAAGTQIATRSGPRAVETLKAGDKVLTADGAETEVVWLGVQPVDVRLAHPARVNPIRITAGALGGGLPERDLLISQDHAIAIDGMLINAGALVNGTTIRQERGKMPDGFAYYHVETQAHELLLAEGVAAESFIDYAGRDGFENGGEAEPRAIPEMDLPRVSTARLVPDRIRDRLAPLPVAAE
jgi:hypothetical protein